MSEQTPEPTTRHALAPEPLTRFITNEIRREELKSILRSPTFIAAMNYLQEVDRVKESDLRSAPDITILRKSAFHASTASIYERLVELTKLSTPHEEQEAWDHLKPTNQ